MSAFDIHDTISRLRAVGRPFCVATVVRTADITSAKAGAKAAVLEDGRLVGHLGGACVSRAVRRAAAGALAAEDVRLIRVKPSERVVSLTDEDGAAVFRSGCPSGGTVDILIEPWRPAPMVAIWGRTPIAVGIARHAALLGWRVAMQADALPDDIGGIAFESAGPGPEALRPEDFAVVAAQGDGDVPALRAALSGPAHRVSMIASARKAARLRERLAAEGIDRARLEALKSPAGLDLGGVDPAEIALAVVAELVAWRNAARTARSLRSGQAEG